MPAPSAEKPKSNRLLDAVLGRQGKLPGEYPLSHYDVGYSSGGLLGSFRPAAILGWLTDIVFTAGRWLTAFAIWAINYALTFGIARSLLDPAAQVAGGYQDAVQRSGLIWVFLVLAVAYAGWHALRGRLAHGLGETLVSFLIATLLAGILAAPATTLLGKNGLLDRTRDISLALAGITLNPERPDTQRGGTSNEISAPMMAKLQHTLVDIPHQVLNWGDVLERPDARPQCLKTHRKLLDDGPWGDADKPREEMKAVGCSDLAKFNEQGSADRLIAAVLVLLAVILACALIVLMAFTVIGAQFVLALLAAFTPLALAAGLLPGSGRQVLWRWASAVLRTLAGVIMTVAALSVVITLATAILRADADMPLAVRMGLLDVFMITAFVFRRRLLDAGRRAAAGVGRRLESVRIGGSGGPRHDACRIRRRSSRSMGPAPPTSHRHPRPPRAPAIGSHALRRPRDGPSRPHRHGIPAAQPEQTCRHQDGPGRTAHRQGRKPHGQDRARRHHWRTGLPTPRSQGRENRLQQQSPSRTETPGHHQEQRERLPKRIHPRPRCARAPDRQLRTPGRSAQQLPAETRSVLRRHSTPRAVQDTRHDPTKAQPQADQSPSSAATAPQADAINHDQSPSERQDQRDTQKATDPSGRPRPNASAQAATHPEPPHRYA